MMLKTKFHNQDISRNSFLVTGGAGFIGSNIVDYLMQFNPRKVRVLDNLSNGSIENIRRYFGYSNFEFIEGDIRDLGTCYESLKDVDYVSHQAALGSVPRSIVDPIQTNDVNITGFLNVLTAVKDNPEVKRMVYAASSSTYGDSPHMPKVEGQEGSPISPYAVTKLVNELYAEVFSNIFNIHTIGLRYFNIFGPKQNPTNPYAAVIAKACYAFIKNIEFTVNGDGLTSRDFTFVENAVQANVKAMFIDNLTRHEVVNIACGKQTTLLEMLEQLGKISGKTIPIKFNPERSGDVKHSRAEIQKAMDLLNYKPDYSFEMGLKLVYEYYQNLKFS